MRELARRVGVAYLQKYTIVTILPLFLAYSFLSSSLLFGTKIYKTFYRSSIINAGLLRDLKSGRFVSFRKLQ